MSTFLWHLKDLSLVQRAQEVLPHVVAQVEVAPAKQGVHVLVQGVPSFK